MGVPLDKINALEDNELKEELLQLYRNKKARESLEFFMRNTISNIVDTLDEYDKDMSERGGDNPHVMAASLAIKGIRTSLMKESIRLGKEVVKISEGG